MYDIDSIVPVMHLERSSVAAGTASIDNVIDSQGHAGGLLLIAVLLDTIQTGAAVGTFQITESDDDSTYTVVPGCNQITDTQADGSAKDTISSTDDDSLVTFYIPLVGARKRYYKLVFTVASAQAVGVSATAFLLGKRIAISPASSSAFDGTAGQVFRAEQV
tara:strand:+ start:1301 stop:1786 length:486 start_codon:yes stop_codon:yes gene_type:complete